MPKRMIHAMDFAPTVKPGRTSRLLVTESTMGVKDFSVGLNITQVGGAGPTHVHENEHETMYIIQGKAKFTVGEEEYIVGPDCIIHAPAGVPHGFQNLGDTDLKFTWTYCPPLPEHR